jgi:protein MBA1
MIVSVSRSTDSWWDRGDLNALRNICGDGLLESFTKRIFARGNVKMEWKIHKYLTRPRVVSNKCHFYPGLNVCRKQAVIRVHTLQVCVARLLLVGRW